MYPKTRLTGIAQVTLFTLESFDFLMIRLNMILQRNFSCECFITMVTIVSNAQMFGSHMMNQFMLVNVDFVTFVTFVFSTSMLSLDMNI